MIVQWRETFAHGRAAIDGDHRMVVDMLNELDVAITVGSPREVVSTALDVLVQRIIEHFRREEADLPACAAGSPIENQEILARVRRLRDDWRQGGRAVLDRCQLLALARWWISHMEAVRRVH